ncbi:MAG TPA: hypothetical protein VJR69_10835 [Nitrospira sp.]|nr:hypothetical protein [Nitrospira sp.]
MNASLLMLSRLLVIGWACVWSAALPLFHTHLPGGLEKSFAVPHTVFSSDLPGEFSAFSHRTAQDEAELSGFAFHSQELGFVASASSDDAKRKSPVQTASLLLLRVVPSVDPTFEQLPVASAIEPRRLWSEDSHGLRAPPSPVSL